MDSPGRSRKWIAESLRTCFSAPVHKTAALPPATGLADPASRSRFRNWLQTHPFPVQAHFDWSLALVYAFPQDVLTPLLAPGLELDIHESWGFIAVAMVQTRKLRPAGFPKVLGRDFFLSGYRVFTRHRTPEGRNLRGLKILRSDTNRQTMAVLGNLFTHYNYHRADVEVQDSPQSLEIRVQSHDGFGDVHLRCSRAATVSLPSTSVFKDLRTARLFAGPMPFTFAPVAEGILRIEGSRNTWKPRPVVVEVANVSFFNQPAFAEAGVPRLSNAFLVEQVDYRWSAGVIDPLQS